jgi:hypothetical protein
MHFILWCTEQDFRFVYLPWYHGSIFLPSVDWYIHVILVDHHSFGFQHIEIFPEKLNFSHHPDCSHASMMEATVEKFVHYWLYYWIKYITCTRNNESSSSYIAIWSELTIEIPPWNWLSNEIKISSLDVLVTETTYDDNKWVNQVNVLCLIYRTNILIGITVLDQLWFFKCFCYFCHSLSHPGKTRFSMTRGWDWKESRYFRNKRQFIFS